MNPSLSCSRCGWRGGVSVHSLFRVTEIIEFPTAVVCFAKLHLRQAAADTVIVRGSFISSAPSVVLNSALLLTVQWRCFSFLRRLSLVVKNELPFRTGSKWKPPLDGNWWNYVKVVELLWNSCSTSPSCLPPRSSAGLWLRIRKDLVFSFTAVV